MTLVLFALRGVAAIAVLTTLAGGIPRVAQAALALAAGLWTALVVLPAAPVDWSWALAAREVALGAALGVLAAVPLIAARTAGRLVDTAGGAGSRGPYEALFGLLAAAVFVGIDGHVAAIRAIVDSHRSLPALGAAETRVLASIAVLVPAAVRLAAPWLVTAAVVQVAAGVGTRLANRAAVAVPTAAAAPAALAMMTAALAGTLAVAFAALVRGFV